MEHSWNGTELGFLPVRKHGSFMTLDLGSVACLFHDDLDKDTLVFHKLDLYSIFFASMRAVHPCISSR